MTTEQTIVRMQDNIEKLTDDVDEIKAMMQDMKQAIMGNPMSNDGGLSGRLVKLEKKVEAFERMKWLIIGAAGASGLAVGEIIDKILR